MSRLRAKLATLIQSALLADFGIRVDVLPENLHPASGWYRTSHMADCYRWEGFGQWHINGSATGCPVTIDGQDTMTDCVRYGVKITRDRASSFEVYAKASALTPNPPSKASN